MPTGPVFGANSPTWNVVLVGELLSFSHTTAPPPPNQARVEDTQSVQSYSDAICPRNVTGGGTQGQGTTGVVLPTVPQRRGPWYLLPRCWALPGASAF